MQSSYPITPLGLALRALAGAKPDIKDGSLSIDALAQAANVALGPAQRLRHDLWLYGLIEDHADHVDLSVLTGRGRALLDAASTGRAAVAREALVAPPILRELHAKLADRTRPEMPDVVALLAGLGVPTAAQRGVAHVYLSSRAFVDELPD